MKVKCNRCGFEKETDAGMGGVIFEARDKNEEEDDMFSVYGNHNCSDGEMGYFIEA